MQKTKYRYADVCFDSFPELAVWCYAIDHQIPIKREPCSIPYIFNFNGQTHFYLPDFEYDGRLIEIKGLQFFKNKDPLQEMVCLFDHSRDAQMEAKYQCAIQNNVEIWTQLDYAFAEEYFEEHYIKTDK